MLKGPVTTGFDTARSVSVPSSLRDEGQGFQVTQAVVPGMNVRSAKISREGFR
jgi:hypothetical protein